MIRQTFPILENSVDGVAIIDASGKVVFWSRSLETITGLTKEAAVDKEIWNLQAKLISQGEQSSNEERLKALWQSGKISDFAKDPEKQINQFTLQKSDGSKVPVEQFFYSCFLEGEDGGTFFVSFIKDISERKKNEEAHENYIKALSHDLRSPLAKIIQFCQVILDEEDLSLEDTKRFVGIIYKVSTQMLKMMESYLLLEKVEHNQGKAEKKPRLISEVADGIKKVFADLKNRDCKLQVILKNPTEELPNPELTKKTIFIDDTLFVSAISNLLQNAIDACPGSDNEITVNIYENQGFCFSVSNAGEIPEEIQKRLFQKFATSKKTGTGLGLFIVKLIAKAHSGDLLYTALPGGTRFTLQIP